MAGSPEVSYDNRTPSTSEGSERLMVFGRRFELGDAVAYSPDENDLESEEARALFEGIASARIQTVVAPMPSEDDLTPQIKSGNRKETPDPPIFAHIPDSSSLEKKPAEGTKSERPIEMVQSNAFQKPKAGKLSGIDVAQEAPRRLQQKAAAARQPEEQASTADASRTETGFKKLEADAERFLGREQHAPRENEENSAAERPRSDKGASNVFREVNTPNIVRLARIVPQMGSTSPETPHYARTVAGDDFSEQADSPGSLYSQESPGSMKNASISSKAQAEQESTPPATDSEGGRAPRTTKTSKAGKLSNVSTTEAQRSRQTERERMAREVYGESSGHSGDINPRERSMKPVEAADNELPALERPKKRPTTTEDSGESVTTGRVRPSTNSAAANAAESASRARRPPAGAVTEPLSARSRVRTPLRSVSPVASKSYDDRNVRGPLSPVLKPRMNRVAAETQKEGPQPLSRAQAIDQDDVDLYEDEDAIEQPLGRERPTKAAPRRTTRRPASIEQSDSLRPDKARAMVSTVRNESTGPYSPDGDGEPSEADSATSETEGMPRRRPVSSRLHPGERDMAPMAQQNGRTPEATLKTASSAGATSTGRVTKPERREKTGSGEQNQMQEVAPSGRKPVVKRSREQVPVGDDVLDQSEETPSPLGRPKGVVVREDLGKDGSDEEDVTAPNRKVRSAAELPAERLRASERVRSRLSPALAEQKASAAAELKPKRKVARPKTDPVPATRPHRKDADESDRSEERRAVELDEQELSDPEIPPRRKTKLNSSATTTRQSDMPTTAPKEITRSRPATLTAQDDEYEESSDVEKAEAGPRRTAPVPSPSVTASAERHSPAPTSRLRSRSTARSARSQGEQDSLGEEETPPTKGAPRRTRDAAATDFSEGESAEEKVAVTARGPLASTKSKAKNPPTKQDVSDTELEESDEGQKVPMEPAKKIRPAASRVRTSEVAASKRALATVKRAPERKAEANSTAAEDQYCERGSAAAPRSQVKAKSANASRTGVRKRPEREDPASEGSSEDEKETSYRPTTRRAEESAPSSAGRTTKTTASELSRPKSMVISKLTAKATSDEDSDGGTTATRSMPRPPVKSKAVVSSDKYYLSDEGVSISSAEEVSEDESVEPAERKPKRKLVPTTVPAAKTSSRKVYDSTASRPASRSPPVKRTSSASEITSDENAADSPQPRTEVRRPGTKRPSTGGPAASRPNVKRRPEADELPDEPTGPTKVSGQPEPQELVEDFGGAPKARSAVRKSAATLSSREGVASEPRSRRQARPEEQSDDQRKASLGPERRERPLRPAEPARTDGLAPAAKLRPKSRSQGPASKTAEDPADGETQRPAKPKKRLVAGEEDSNVPARAGEIPPESPSEVEQPIATRVRPKPRPAAAGSVDKPAVRKRPEPADSAQTTDRGGSSAPALKKDRTLASQDAVEQEPMRKSARSRDTNSASPAPKAPRGDDAAPITAPAEEKGAPLKKPVAGRPRPTSVPPADGPKPATGTRPRPASTPPTEGSASPDAAPRRPVAHRAPGSQEVQSSGPPPARSASPRPQRPAATRGAASQDGQSSSPSMRPQMMARPSPLRHASQPPEDKPLPPEPPQNADDRLSQAFKPASRFSFSLRKTSDQAYYDPVDTVPGDEDYEPARKNSWWRRLGRRRNEEGQQQQQQQQQPMYYMMPLPQQRQQQQRGGGMVMMGDPIGRGQYVMMPAMQGMPMQGMPKKGMPMQGSMPMQGMPMQGMPMQGMPMMQPGQYYGGGWQQPVMGNGMHGMEMGLGTAHGDSADTLVYADDDGGGEENGGSSRSTPLPSRSPKPVKRASPAGTVPRGTGRGEGRPRARADTEAYDDGYVDSEEQYDDRGRAQR